MTTFDLQDDETRRSVRAAIKEIADNNSSGAAEMLRRALVVFSLLEEASVASSIDLKQARDLIIETCASIARAQPLMTPLANLASFAMTAVLKTTGAQEVFNSAISAARDFIEKAERAASIAAQRAAELIYDGATVLAHSRSSTAVAAFIHARRAGKSFNVIATESRPVMEGRALARSLADEQVTVTLVADMSAALMMERANLVIVGADQLTPEYIINKIGTRMIALAARERGLPIYALCDSSKFTAHTARLIEGPRSAQELWPDAPELVTVLNRYFEPTPLAHFSSVVTEDGAIDPQEAARLASSVKLHPALLDALEMSRA